MGAAGKIVSVACRQDKPMVSVLMPSRDAESFVATAIRSILGQSFQDFEFLIIDDGSVDRTPEIIGSFDDPRIKFVRYETSRGIPEVRNELISRSCGKYLALMDNDDAAHPRRFEFQVSLLERRPSVGVCGTWMETFGEGRKYLHKHESSHDELRCQVIFESPLAGPSCMLRSELLKKHREPYNPSFRFAADYELAMRLISETEFENIPLVLHRYRRHRGQTSEIRRAEIVDETRKVQRMCLESLGMDFSEADLKLHELISKWEFQMDPAFAEAAHDWFLRLLRANEARKHLNPQVFRRLLSQRFFAIAAFFAPCGNAALSRLRSLPLHREAEVGSRARCVQFVRGLLRAGIRRPEIPASVEPAATSAPKDS